MHRIIFVYTQPPLNRLKSANNQYIFNKIKDIKRKRNKIIFRLHYFSTMKFFFKANETIQLKSRQKITFIGII